MWRAYTREKPARQGLALIIVAVSSAAVAAFAGAVVNYKSTPMLSGENRAPSDWPITFKLPADFEETTAIRPSQLDSSLMSFKRRLIFKNKVDARRRIGIGHQRAEESNIVMDGVIAITERMTSKGNETFERIEIPSIHPDWLIIQESRGDAATYLATLVSPDRSLVRIAFATPSPSVKDRRVLASVCNSVAPREGFTEPEEAE